MTVQQVSALVDALADIGRWYAATADPPRAAESQTHAAPGSRTPIAADVLSTRRTTIDRLTSWALLVAQERDLRPGIAASDVPALVRFLGVHAEWLVQHDGRHVVDELTECARELEQIVRQSQPVRVDLGPCPEVGCDGLLRAVVRRSDDYLPSRVRCNAEAAHTWEPNDWHALGRRTKPMRPAAARRLLGALTDLDAPRSSGTGHAHADERPAADHTLDGLTDTQAS